MNDGTLMQGYLARLQYDIYRPGFINHFDALTTP